MKTKKVLLVEDDPFLVDIYTTKLNEFGYSVITAFDGEEAIKKAEEEMPDLLLLDIVLPNVDGWEIIQKIKQNEKLKGLGIVILSNLGQKEEIEKGLKLGAMKYLVKAHHTPSEVATEVKKILK
jgi:DNA-binding response OmpR family regulator